MEEYNFHKYIYGHKLDDGSDLYWFNIHVIPNCYRLDLDMIESLANQILSVFSNVEFKSIHFSKIDKSDRFHHLPIAMAHYKCSLEEMENIISKENSKYNDYSDRRWYFLKHPTEYHWA